MKRSRLYFLTAKEFFPSQTTTRTQTTANLLCNIFLTPSSSSWWPSGKNRRDLYVVHTWHNTQVYMSSWRFFSCVRHFVLTLGQERNEGETFFLPLLLHRVLYGQTHSKAIPEGGKRRKRRSFWKKAVETMTDDDGRTDWRRLLHTTCKQLPLKSAVFGRGVGSLVGCLVSVSIETYWRIDTPPVTIPFVRTKRGKDRSKS